MDIEGIDLSPELRELVAKVKPDDPNIAGIRVGQNAPGVVRLVVDLKQAAQPQVFTLPPIAAYQHRLVFDLYPAEPVDPLEALIAERLARHHTAAAPTAGATGQNPARQAQRTSRPAGRPDCPARRPPGPSATPPRPRLRPAARPWRQPPGRQATATPDRPHHHRGAGPRPRR